MIKKGTWQDRLYGSDGKLEEAIKKIRQQEIKESKGRARNYIKVNPKSLFGD